MKNEETNNQNLQGASTNSWMNEENARKEGTAKGAVTATVIGLIVLVAVGIITYTLYNREHIKQLSLMEMQKQDLTGQLTARDSVINEWVLTFDQIEKDLGTVKQKENLITLEASDTEFSKEKKQQILDDIRYINTILDQNKKKIAGLNALLKNSGIEIKSLQDKIAGLEASMKLRDDDIAKLKTALVDKDFEVGQLNTQMTELQMTIAQKDEKITDQTDEMNKAFLVFGTYKELKEKGLISKEGGFLGLGRKEGLLEDFADSSFTQINVTETKTIPVNSKDAKLITEHPTGSYELIRANDNTIAYIDIKDPDEFWKISKYAVVEINK
jgi:flagellar biosynthesis chaperone FliJ